MHNDKQSSMRQYTYNIKLCTYPDKEEQVTASGSIDNVLGFLFCSQQLLDSTLTPAGCHAFLEIKPTTKNKSNRSKLAPKA